MCRSHVDLHHRIAAWILFVIHAADMAESCNIPRLISVAYPYSCNGYAGLFVETSRLYFDEVCVV